MAKYMYKTTALIMSCNMILTIDWCCPLQRVVLAIRRGQDWAIITHTSIMVCLRMTCPRHPRRHRHEAVVAVLVCISLPLFVCFWCVAIHARYIGVVFIHAYQCGVAHLAVLSIIFHVPWIPSLICCIAAYMYLRLLLFKTNNVLFSDRNFQEIYAEGGLKIK